MAIVWIKLNIRGSQEDADRVVDELLDQGVPQDAINEHEVEGCKGLRVLSAMADRTPEALKSKSARIASTRRGMGRWLTRRTA